jgi:hypothetical protein
MSELFNIEETKPPLLATLRSGYEEYRQRIAKMNQQGSPDWMIDEAYLSLSEIGDRLRAEEARIAKEVK